MFFRKINIIILNLWFYLWAPFVLLGALLIFVPFVTIIRIFSKRKTMFYFRKAINLYGRAVTLTAWPWIKIKLHDIPKMSGVPYVIVENHTSSFDPFIQGVLPFEIVQSAKGWALRFPLLGRFARWAGYIDVDGGDSDELLQQAKRLIDDEVSLVFFPEGTRNVTDKLSSFHSFAFSVAIDTSTPILPIITMGVADKPKKGSFIMNPGVIDMRCMDIIEPDSFKDFTPFVLKKEIKAKMEEFLLKHNRKK